MIAAMTLGQLIRATTPTRNRDIVDLKRFQNIDPREFEDAPTETVGKNLRLTANDPTESIKDTTICYAAMKEQEYLARYGRKRSSRPLYKAVVDSLITGEWVSYDLANGEKFEYIQKRCHQIAERNYDKIMCRHVSGKVWIHRKP